MVNARPGRFTPRNDLGPIVQEVGWVPGLVWKGGGDLLAPQFDLQTHQSIAGSYTVWLYRLRYPNPHSKGNTKLIFRYINWNRTCKNSCIGELP
jgi:hypothetical protein